jgi:hypothetical protein
VRKPSVSFVLYCCSLVLIILRLLALLVQNMKGASADDVQKRADEDRKRADEAKRREGEAQKKWEETYKKLEELMRKYDDSQAKRFDYDKRMEGLQKELTDEKAKKAIAGMRRVGWAPVHEDLMWQRLRRAVALSRLRCLPQQQQAVTTRRWRS